MYNIEMVFEKDTSLKLFQWQDSVPLVYLCNCMYNFI